MTLSEQLDIAMREAYAVTGKETGYWGRYFLRSVKQHGGLTTAKRMLSKRLKNPSEQKGFRALVEAGRPDLSLESLVLQKRFRGLFTSAELTEAERRLASVPGYAKRTPVAPDTIHADDLPADEEFAEGAKKRITVNAYERDPKARAACLKRHGYSCQVCGMRFQDVYGDIGRKFIHVHHKKPLAGRRRDYKVKPTIDLAPVCPNCHAMLHSSDPPLGIEELKRRMANKKNAAYG
ncbi:MAG: HNH endonuclease [Planctomycetes bacterium]|nr:HNH endonuclease [Planctomycetota bacterium]